MTDSPTSRGRVEHGVEWVLWRPGLDLALVRRQAIRESVSGETALYGAVGVGLVGWGLVALPAMLWPLWAGGGALVAFAAVWARVDYLCWGHDLRRGRWERARADRGHGALFFREGDFAGLPGQWQLVARRVIECVASLHTGPAVGWLDPEHLRAAHRVAWETLVCLDRSAPARLMVEHLDRTGESPEVVEATRTELAALDECLHAILLCLTRTAEHVLDLNRLLGDTAVPDTGRCDRERWRTELDALHLDATAPPVQTAAEVLRAVEAHVAAARDVLTAGLYQRGACP
ncbi:hypothetical protein F0L68_33400 [Solihabitans fulvus]|uniref:Uncharacterized protein n=1 Tax=Solihabitans fulvus TaxID=1892852 RepID=A0A5B2WQR6_9PSEU|nr:hypothetical protein [Solihabitans fulvus]KAA2253308.1 hypothetical protein F0L68_33400 [Solihabitans fulvus]